MANKPNLLVYSTVMTSGSLQFIEDISPVATGYQHVIRLLGGYWTASWKIALEDVGQRMYDEWKANRFGCHFVEEYRGQTTWEGAIEGIQPDDDKGVIDITAYGYVHSIQNRYNSTTDTALADANVWLATLVTADCDMIVDTELSANTLQCYQAGDDRVWDEMLKVVELGDGITWVPWQLGVYNGRRLIYKVVSTTPLGYVRGGIRWRVDGPNDLINYVVVRYTDEAGAAQLDIVSGLAESQAVYGRREMRLERSNLPTASATVLASQYAYEHMWPYMRAVGCGKAIQVYDGIGCNNALSPWIVQPGVYMDTALIGGSKKYLSWLPANCFLADEVVATESGAQLRTSKWDESDALDAYYDYLDEIPDVPKAKKHRKRRKGGGSSGGGTGGSSGGSSGGGGSTGGGRSGGTGGGRNTPPPGLPD
jgi:uncharacterized membrane protein YgcG